MALYSNRDSPIGWLRLWKRLNVTRKIRKNIKSSLERENLTTLAVSVFLLEWQLMQSSLISRLFKRLAHSLPCHSIDQAIASIPRTDARVSSFAAGPLGIFSPRSRLLTTPTVTFK